MNLLRLQPMVRGLSPSPARRRAVCRHVRGIAHQLVWAGACSYDPDKQGLADIAPHPPVAAVVDRCMQPDTEGISCRRQPISGTFRVKLIARPSSMRG